MALVNHTIMTEQEIVDDFPEVYNSLIPLLRTQPTDLDTYLQSIAFDVEITNTKTHAHCHFIQLDGNKRPRVKDFARFIGHKITDFAIPRSEIKRALNEAVRLGSATPTDELNSKARSLFTSLPTSGEGGEVLLSVLAETFLKLPQLFSKMVLKTNPEVHVHGCDGVHIGVNTTNGNLALYWGESKLYSDAASAARECFSSLAPFLLGAGGADAAQERDLQLMRDGIELNDIQLENALKRFLNPKDPMFNKMEYRGLCLIGFDSEAYPTMPNSKEIEQLKSDIEKVFDDRKKHIQKRVTEENIHTFEIQVFCLPFPNVDDFRLEFRRQLGLTDE